MKLDGFYLMVMMKRITRIQPQARHSRRVNVDLDGEFAFGLAQSVAAGLTVGQELSDQDIIRIVESESDEKAYLCALGYLARRDHSETELRRKLAQKGFSEERIGRAIDRVRECGYIDDRRFAENWIRSQSRFRPRSARMLRYELKLKGVSDPVISESLAGVDDEQAAFDCAEKYSRRLAGLDQPVFRNRLGAYLARRGFSYETVRTTVQAAWNSLHSETDDDII